MITKIVNGKTLKRYGVTGLPKISDLYRLVIDGRLIKVLHYHGESSYHIAEFDCLTEEDEKLIIYAYKILIKEGKLKNKDINRLIKSGIGEKIIDSQFLN